MGDQTTLTPAPAAPPPPRAGPWATRRVRVLGAVTGVVLAALATVVTLRLTQGHTQAATADSKVPAAWSRPVVSAAGLAERSGVKIIHVAVTGGGGLIDLRYQVIDPDAASAVHDEATPPAVVDERTGLVVHELYMNHEHKDDFKAGVTYYFVFNNPGNVVTRGSKVVVLLGDAQVEHVVVR